MQASFECADDFTLYDDNFFVFLAFKFALRTVAVFVLECGCFSSGHFTECDDELLLLYRCNSH